MRRPARAMTCLLSDGLLFEDSNPLMADVPYGDGDDVMSKSKLGVVFNGLLEFPGI